MEIKYQLFEREYLLIQKFIGLFSIEHYISYTRFIMKNFASSLVKKVLVDLRYLNLGIVEGNIRNVDFIEKVERIIDIRKNINKGKSGNNDILVVFLVDKPLPTVIAHLFTDNFPNKDYKYCSTTETALKIIEVSEHLNNLQYIIDNLENTF